MKAGAVSLYADFGRGNQGDVTRDHVLDVDVAHRVGIGGVQIVGVRVEHHHGAVRRKAASPTVAVGLHTDIGGGDQGGAAGRCEGIKTKDKYRKDDHHNQ